MNLAVEEPNKENFRIKGKPVSFEVIAVDDRANADTGKEVAQQLVNAGVVAVIGTSNSGVSIAAAPIYAEKGIAQMAISTNPKFTSLGSPPRSAWSPTTTCRPRRFGSFSSTHFTSTRYAVLDDGTPYGKGPAAVALRRS